MLGLHAKKHTGDFYFPFPKWAFDYHDAFKWNAKNQTLGWIICSVLPTAVVKIKGSMQQIAKHSSRSLFFVNFYVCRAMGGGWGSLFYYDPKQAVKSSFSFQKHYTSSRRRHYGKCTFSANSDTPWGKWTRGSRLARSTWTEPAHDRKRVSASSC